MQVRDACRQRDVADAERAVAGLARQRPSGQAWKLLGMTYSAQEKYNQAEEPCRRACQLDPREENACYYLGRVYYTLSRLAESRKAYEAALRNGGGARGAVRLAMRLERLRETGEAQRCLRPATDRG